MASAHWAVVVVDSTLVVRQLVALPAAVAPSVARQAGVWVQLEHKALQVETPAVETSTLLQAAAAAQAVQVTTLPALDN
jgi:hypothetical protein